MIAVFVPPRGGEGTMAPDTPMNIDPIVGILVLVAIAWFWWKFIRWIRERD